MQVRASFRMGPEEDAAYVLTLRGVQEASSRFSSWEAMIAAEDSTDVSSSSHRSFLPAAPERSLLEVWLVAATTGRPQAAKDAAATADEAAGRCWTRFLALWISLRLAGLIVSTNATDPTSRATTCREVETYEQCFIAAAWPLLESEQRRRIELRIAYLRKLCEAASPQRCKSSTAIKEAPASGEDDSDEAACLVICNSAVCATQCVAREYLRIAWDFLDPKKVPAMVDGHLRILFSIPQPLQPGTCELSTAAPTLAESCVVHTSCMRDLLQTLQRTLQQPHAADQTCQVWTRVVRTALLRIGYNLIVKIHASMIEFCYFLIPAVVDFEACVMLCEVMENERKGIAASSTDTAGDAEAAEEREQLRRTLAALLQSTQAVYEAKVAQILSGYRRSCVSAATPPRLLTVTAVEAACNPLTTLPPAALQCHATPTQNFRETLPTPTAEGGNGAACRPLQLVLSQAAYALLVEVVEPTCNVLRRYRTESRLHRRGAPTDAAARRESSGQASNQLMQSAVKDSEERGGAGEERTTRVRQESTLSLPPAVHQAFPAVRQSFVRFFKEKLDSCFAEALRDDRPKTASAKAQEQAEMDTRLVAAYFSAAMHR